MIVAGLLLSACSKGDSEYQGASPVRTQSLYLIKHGWDMPTPAFIKRHISAMARSPFDGVVVRVPDVSDRLTRPIPISASEMSAALAPLAAARATPLSHNFVLVHTTPIGDLFGDLQPMLANFATLAQAAPAVGAAGVFLDVEEYFGSVWATQAACPGRSREACQTQAYLRGGQVVEAMSAQWPRLTIITTFGPWLSDPHTARVLSPHLGYTDLSASTGVLGWFVAGMVEAAARTGVTMVDGGEIYSLRSVEQFLRAYDWLKTGIATKGSVVRPEFRQRYPASVSVGFGVYDRPTFGQDMNSDVWRETLTEAMRTADQYVWAYTETNDWWGVGWPQHRVSEPWVQATWRARRQAANYRPLARG